MDNGFNMPGATAGIGTRPGPPDYRDTRGVDHAPSWARTSLWLPLVAFFSNPFAAATWVPGG
jgi:hypothetical protein